MQRSRSSSVKQRKPESSSSQENSTVESESRQKKTKTAPGESSILSHFKVLDERSSVDSVSSATAEQAHAMDDCDRVSDSQGPEPTNRDIMRMLQTINATLTNKLDSLSDTVERLQGEIFDLQENNKKLTKELEDYRQRETEMKSQVEEAKFNAKLAEQCSNQNEQYSRLWNLKILFIPEKSGKAQETPEVS